MQQHSEKKPAVSYSRYFNMVTSFIAVVGLGRLFGGIGAAAESVEGGSVQNTHSLQRRSIQALQTIPVTNLPLIADDFAGRFTIGSSTIEKLVFHNNQTYAAAGKDGIFSLDIPIANVNQTTVITQYNTPGFAHDLTVVDDRYLFVPDGNSGAQIVDSINPGIFTLAGVYLNSFHLQTIPTTRLAVINNEAFLLDEKSGHIDVADVTSPAETFHVYVDTLSDARKVVIKGDYALASDGSEGFQIINIKNPSAPYHVSNFVSGGYLYDIAVAGNIVCLAGSSVDLTLVDITDVNNPTRLGRFDVSGRAVAVEISGNTVYVLTQGSGLYIVNISDPNNPQLYSQYSLSWGATGLCLRGNLLYVAHHSDDLFIFDVTDPRAPRLLSNLRFSGNPRGIDVVGTMVYMVGDSIGLHIVDAIVPASPQYRSSLRLPGDSQDVTVNGTDVLVADGGVGLERIDASDSLNPRLVRTYDLPGWSYGVSFMGEFALVTANNAGMHIVKLDRQSQSYSIPFSEHKPITVWTPYKDFLFYADATRWVALDSRNFKVNQNVPVANLVRATDLVDGRLYAAGEYGKNFVIFDAGTLAFLGDFDASGTELATDIKVIGSTAYLLEEDAGLLLVDVSDPANPREMSRLSMQDDTSSLVMYKGLAIVAATGAGVQLVDVSVLTAPRIISTYPAADARGVAVYADILVVANSYDGLDFVSIKDPSSPRFLSRITLPGRVVHVVTLGYWAIVASDGGGFFIVDFSDPINPQLMGGSRQPTLAYRVSVNGKEVYIAQRQAGLHSFEISDPTHPESRNTYNTPGIAWDVKAVPGKVIVSDDVDGVQIIEVIQQNRQFVTDNMISHLVADNDIAYIIDVAKQLQLLDISDMDNLKELSVCDLEFHVTDMVIGGQYLYLAQGLNGVAVYDVSDPAAPQFAGRITQGLNNARSVKLRGNQLFVIDENKAVSAFDIRTLSYLTLENNQITIAQGERHIITEEELSAIAINTPTASGDVSYTITNPQHIHFELTTALGVTITDFTDAQVKAKQVLGIHDNTEFKPSFDIEVKSGAISDGPYAAIINYVPVNDPPVMVKNQIRVNQDEEVTVTIDDIWATDIDSTQLTIIVDQLTNCQFSHKDNPDVIITRFSLQDVIDKKIQYKHVTPPSGKNIEPSYQALVTDGEAESPFMSATTDFNAAPIIERNRLVVERGVDVILTTDDLLATDDSLDNLEYSIHDPQNCQFELTTAPGVPILNFTHTQLEAREVKVHPIGNQALSYRVSVRDSRMTAGDSTADITFTTSGEDNTLKIALSVSAGVGALALLSLLTALLTKRHIDSNSRNKAVLADKVRSALKLQGVDNFKTERGKKYVTVINNMVNQFNQNHLDVNQLSDKELERLAQQISRAAKGKITIAQTYLFKQSLITVDELDNYTDSIVSEVLQQRNNGQDFVEINLGYSGEEDDNEIAMKTFIPNVFGSGNNANEGSNYPPKLFGDNTNNQENDEESLEEASCWPNPFKKSSSYETV